MTRIIHYTYGHHLASILRSGCLLATGVSIPPHERPSLWYSTREDFEPTALKPVRFPGEPNPVRLTMQELHELAGVYRFATDTERVRAKPFAQACRELGILPTDAQAMIRVGNEMGSRHEDWYATPRHQPLSLHEFERWTGANWEPAHLPTEVERRKGDQVRGSATGDRWSDVLASAPFKVRTA